MVNCLTCMQIHGKNKAQKFSRENKMNPLQWKATADIIINLFFRILALGENGTLHVNILTWKPVWHKLRTFKDAWVYDERAEKSAERLSNSFLKEGHAEARRCSTVIPLCVFLNVCSLMSDSSHALSVGSRSSLHLFFIPPPVRFLLSVPVPFLQT